MRIFELQVFHWDQIMRSSFWKLIAMTPYKKKSHYKLKLDPRKLAPRPHGISFESLDTWIYLGDIEQDTPELSF